MKTCTVFLIYLMLFWHGRRASLGQDNVTTALYQMQEGKQSKFERSVVVDEKYDWENTMHESEKNSKFRVNRSFIKKRRGNRMKRDLNRKQMKSSVYIKNNTLINEKNKMTFKKRKKTLNKKINKKRLKTSQDKPPRKEKHFKIRISRVHRFKKSNSTPWQTKKSLFSGVEEPEKEWLDHLMKHHPASALMEFIELAYKTSNHENISKTNENDRETRLYRKSCQLTLRHNVQHIIDVDSLFELQTKKSVLAAHIFSEVSSSHKDQALNIILSLDSSISSFNIKNNLNHLFTNEVKRSRKKKTTIWSQVVEMEDDVINTKWGYLQSTIPPMYPTTPPSTPASPSAQQTAQHFTDVWVVPFYTRISFQ